jgi:hypothetical protein
MKNPGLIELLLFAAADGGQGNFSVLYPMRSSKRETNDWSGIDLAVGCDGGQ